MMASKQVGYTPLELLLLFRSSLDHGVEAESFGRISETLRNNEFVKGDEHYDPMRLAPELLQKQFFRMIGHELRGGPEETNGTTDGTAGPTAGKKKQASPSPPSRTEVAANLDKVAAMLQKLYTQYREYTLRKVQEEERLYDNVQKEIGLIKKSENERLARLAAAQQNNQPPALAPREVKPAVSSPHTAPPTPTPASAAAAAVAAANAKRPSVPNTPVAPPRLPAQASAPAHSPSVTPVRPPSAQPPSGPVATPPVLQAPTGVPQQQNRALQPPQTARPSISPRPAETPHKPPASQPQAAPVQGQGQLKWEKPYQPQSAQTPPPRPYQPSPAPPKSAVQQQHAQNQQQWQQHMQAQYAQHAQHTQHAQHAQHAQHGQPGQHAQHAQHAQQTPHTQQVQQAQQAQQVQQVQQAQQAQGQMQQAPVQPSAQVPPQQIPPQQQHQQQQHQQQQHPQHGKAPVLVPPQGPGQAIQPPSPSPARAGGVASLAAHSPSPQPRPPAKALTPAPAPTPTASRPVHAIQPHQPQQGQQLPHGQHAQQQPRPIASASPTSASGPSAPPPQRRPQGQYPQQQAANVTPVGSPAPAPQDKNYASPYTKPAIPEHMIRHAAAGTPKVSKVKRTPAKLPQTPVQKASPSATLRATDTIWTPKTTKATIQPSAGLVELESPAYEPLSPPTQPAVLPMSAPAKQLGRPFPSVEEPSPKPVKSRTRSVQKGSATWAGRRAQSVASQPDELAMDQPEYSTKVKNEVLTPRANDDAGETTADESVQGRDNYTTPMGISRVPKRRRQDTPPTPSGPPSHVLWTRGFTKVSSSALDQISSHRDANMFATTVREKNAPNYRQIVLQPQDITSIRSAIKSGNKAAHQAANSLPNGDPGTATVWLPASEDLMPPKGIINSGQLESELVHMFCNAIMYNPDPQRGPGASFMKRAAEEEEEATGYLMDENGVVKNTVAMFLEVEKLLGDLRSAEKERSAPPTTTTTMTTMTAAAAAAAASNAGNAMSTPRPASMAATTPADDTAEEEDELAGDGDAASGTASRKRRMTYKT